jgi:hypothetical protein
VTRPQRPTSLRRRAANPFRWTSATCPHAQTGAPGDPGAEPAAPVSRLAPLGSNRSHAHPGTEQPPVGRTLTTLPVPA